MKHAFISPINYLHLIPQSSDYHLILAHLIDNTVLGKKYIEFYKKRKERGDFIILDNSAFEFKKPMDPEEYKRRIDLLGFLPDVIVAPDYPFEEWDKTVTSTEKFSKEYIETLGAEVKLMAVPQSVKGNAAGWIRGYVAMCGIPNVEFIGMSILGIPNAFCLETGTEDISFNRTYASIQMVENKIADRSKKHHFLGCGSPRELLMMKAVGLAYGNDSSTAFWHGCQLIEFDDTVSGLKAGKSPIEVDFYRGKSTHILYEDYSILKNIEWISRMGIG